MTEIHPSKGSKTQPWTIEPRGTVRLLASVEKETGRHFFPPLPETSPLAGRFDTVALAEEAILYSYTTIHPSPKTGKPPFTLAYADFPENVRVFGQLVVPPGERPQIGSRLRVELTTRADGLVEYLFTLSS